MRYKVRPIATILVVSLMLTACGGDDSTAVDDGPTDQDSSESENSTSESGTDPTTAPDDSDETSSEPAGGGTLEIVLDDGRSWSLEQYKCNYTPDNEGRFVELWGAGATVATGGEFIVTMATPATAEGTENMLVGTFIDDANEILFPIIEGEAVSDGTTMTMTLGMYKDGLTAVGEPIDFTATVTCSL